MEAIAAAVASTGVLGALIGSFLNVVVHRLPRGESLVSPRSRCPGCGAALAAYDNVPIVSWLLLGGRCRSCATRISARYPLIELLTALAFASVALVRGVDERLLLGLPFAAMLIAVAAIDLERQIIPNRILVPAAIYGLVMGAVLRFDDLPELLAAGAGAFTLLLLSALAYPAGMGMGDVKLAGVIGLYLGLSVAPALLIAFLAGSVVGLALVAGSRKGERVRGIPFGPFLAFGAYVGLLAGPELIDLYERAFLS